MKVLIKYKENLTTRYNTGRECSNYNESLQSVAGQWVEVDTSHLFENQYNLVKPNLRIFDGDIMAIEDDARIGLAKCGYCGTMAKVGEPCPKYRNRDQFELYMGTAAPSDCDKYPMQAFTENNCHFIKYPYDFCMNLDNFQEISKDEKTLGSYGLEKSYQDGFLKLWNYQKSFTFKYDGKRFILHGSCGFHSKRNLDIPNQVQNQLKSVLKLMTA